VCLVSKHARGSGKMEDEREKKRNLLGISKV